MDARHVPRRSEVGPADVVHDDGDVQILVRLDELGKVMPSLRCVCDEVADVRPVRLPLHALAQLPDHLLHLRLVPPVQDHVEPAG